MQGAAPVFSRVLTCSQLLMSHRMGCSNAFQCTWYKFPNLSRTLAYQGFPLCFLTVRSFNSLFFQVTECSHSSPHKYSTTLPATQDTWWQDGLCFSFLQSHHFSFSYILLYGAQLVFITSGYEETSSDTLLLDTIWITQWKNIDQGCKEGRKRSETTPWKYTVVPVWNNLLIQSWTLQSIL